MVYRIEQIFFLHLAHNQHKRAYKRMEPPQNSQAKFTEANFRELFHAHFSGLCLFSVKYIKDMDAARDIVHEAFVNLWNKRETIDPDKSVKAYLTTSVYNRSINYLRDTKKFNRDLLTLDEAQDFGDAYHTDRLVEQELAAKIKSAIDLLPEKCREIFLLSRNENLKYQQIADKLQISIKTVETQMSKALQHLRQHLGEYLTLLLVFTKLFTEIL